VQAVCEAADKFGIEEIVLNDSHDNGEREPNVLVKGLPRNVRVIRRPYLPSKPRRALRLGKALLPRLAGAALLLPAVRGADARERSDVGNENGRPRPLRPPLRPWLHDEGSIGEAPNRRAPLDALPPPSHALSWAVMTGRGIVAVIAGCLLLLLMGFQALLALGLPLGDAAWGGKHRVLPTKLRWASVGAVLILGLSAWTVLARAGLIAPGEDSTIVRAITWTFSGYFTLGIAMNAASRSAVERYAMTPVASALAVSFFLVALS